MLIIFSRLWYIIAIILVPSFTIVAGSISLFQAIVLLFKKDKPIFEIIFLFLIGSFLITYLPFLYWLAGFRRFAGDFLVWVITLSLISFGGGGFFLIRALRLKGSFLIKLYLLTTILISYLFIEIALNPELGLIGTIIYVVLFSISIIIVCLMKKLYLKILDSVKKNRLIDIAISSFFLIIITVVIVFLAWNQMANWEKHNPDINRRLEYDRSTILAYESVHLPRSKQ